MRRGKGFYSFFESNDVFNLSEFPSHISTRLLVSRSVPPINTSNLQSYYSNKLCDLKKYIKYIKYIFLLYNEVVMLLYIYIYI